MGSEMCIRDRSESLDTTGSLAFFGGLLTVQDAATLTAIGQRMSKPFAIVMDAAAWGEPSSEHHDAVQLLQRHGWAVEQYGPGASFTKAWTRAMTRRGAA